MTDLEDTEIWLTVSEIADLKLDTLPHTRAAVLKWAKKRSWEKKERKGSGGGYFYSFVSLPEDARLEIKQKCWQQVCEISKDRRFKKAKGIYRYTEKYKIEETALLSAERHARIECIQRLVLEEDKRGYSRDKLASELGLSLDEFAEYELARKTFEILHWQTLKKLGFDVWFILFGEKTKTDRHIHNELNYNQGNVNIKN